MPSKGFGEKGKESKLRLTVALFVTSAGESEKPIVIGNRQTQELLSDLIKVYYQRRILTKRRPGNYGILGKLNTNSNRSILLLVDNAGCHPEYPPPEIRQPLYKGQKGRPQAWPSFGGSTVPAIV